IRAVGNREYTNRVALTVITDMREKRLERGGALVITPVAENHHGLYLVAGGAAFRQVLVARLDRVIQSGLSLREQGVHQGKALRPSLSEFRVLARPYELRTEGKQRKQILLSHQGHQLLGSVLGIFHFVRIAHAAGDVQDEHYLGVLFLSLPELEDRVDHI